MDHDYVKKNAAEHGRDTCRLTGAVDENARAGRISKPQGTVEQAMAILSSRTMNGSQLEQVDLIKANAAMLYASIQTAARGAGASTQSYKCFEQALETIEDAVMWATKGVSRQNHGPF